MIFSATQRCNIVVKLFRVVTTLFQHCNNVLCLKSLLCIVPSNITLRDHRFFFVEVMAVFFFLWLLLCFLYNLGASQRTRDHLHLSFQLIQMNQRTVFVIRYAAFNVNIISTYNRIYFKLKWYTPAPYLIFYFTVWLLYFLNSISTCSPL